MLTHSKLQIQSYTARKNKLWLVKQKKQQRDGIESLVEFAQHRVDQSAAGGAAQRTTQPAALGEFCKRVKHTEQTKYVTCVVCSVVKEIKDICLRISLGVKQCSVREA